MTTATPNIRQQVFVGEYPQLQLDFVIRNPEETTELRRVYDSFQRKLTSVEGGLWNHYCHTWQLLDGLLEQQGLGWCPMSVCPVPIKRWTIAYVHLETSHYPDMGWAGEAPPSQEAIWLYDVPDYQQFLQSFWATPLGKRVDPIQSVFSANLKRCQIGDLFADKERDEAWRLLLREDIPLGNITTAPPELYAQHDLVKPDCVGRPFGRYLRTYPRS